MSIKVNVACPVCRQTITYVHNEAEAWGSLSLTDTGIVEITGHDRGAISEHMRPHREDGSFMAAWERKIMFEQDRATRYFSKLGE